MELAKKILDKKFYSGEWDNTATGWKSKQAYERMFHPFDYWRSIFETNKRTPIHL